MEFHRRVTLRCLGDDISEWDDARHAEFVRELRAVAQDVGQGRSPDSALGRVLRKGPHLSKLSHPLIRHFGETFVNDAEEVRREAISSVRDRLWWKVKSGRWRGAATQPNPVEPLVWLAAAALRRSGSREDFYEAFARSCTAGSEGFLPCDEDHTVLRVESNIARLDAWRLQSQMTVLMLISHALNDSLGGDVEVKHPSKDHTIARIGAVVESIEERGEALMEVIVSMKPQSVVDGPWVTELSEIIIGTLSASRESVRVAPLGSTDSGSLSFACYVGSDLMAEVAHALKEGRPRRLASDVHVGAIAHRIPREHAVAATIAGLPVEALCGYWLVPLSDFIGKPECPTCLAVWSELPEGESG